ncbi:MAG: TMEM165/GDT1 family protein [Deltaproteobacteria bacterium]|nr:TMEM165/GDT1 family protein [Deltaproteobacteria bacterium]
MDIKVFVATFGLVFLAELGDKTQLATFCFAAENQSRLAVFLGAAGALVLASLLAVILGCQFGKIFPEHYVRLGAGGLFVVLGLWMLFSPGAR